MAWVREGRRRFLQLKKCSPAKNETPQRCPRPRSQFIFFVCKIPSVFFPLETLVDVVPWMVHLCVAPLRRREPQCRPSSADFECVVGIRSPSPSLLRSCFRGHANASLVKGNHFHPTELCRNDAALYQAPTSSCFPSVRSKIFLVPFSRLDRNG